MNILAEIRNRFRPVLDRLSGDSAPLLEMIRPAQDPKFGDYQANCAMPLGKRLRRPPRDVAEEIVGQVDLSDLLAPPEIAGPGFINLRLKEETIVSGLTRALRDPRLGIALSGVSKTYVIDYSSPNVAKPMHVGHIRSTVIGDSLCRTLRFLGRRVISDNHLGDWGTQFGMIIYGYKHFGDRAAYQNQPVAELCRLYTLTHQLVEYHEEVKRLPELERIVEEREAAVRGDEAAGAPRGKEEARSRRRRRAQADAARAELERARAKLHAVDRDPRRRQLALDHREIGRAVLEETAKLHAGDPENRRLWREFVDRCRRDIQRTYNRLDIRFDAEHGESFYHDQLAGVVEDFLRKGLARESDGAICVFLEGFDTPMIIQKKDGAYLYATSDLATIRFRMETWRPDAILYVVDHRQSEHFAKLFAAARLWGYRDVQLEHIRFGAVLDEEGRPFKTRSGDAVGLEGLLDEAVQKAREVVSANDDAKPDGPELTAEQRERVAQVVGHGAIKYADLSHNRESDYVFSYEKMMALEGNTAAYMQYCYARTRNIFARGGIDAEALRTGPADFDLQHPLERALALALVRFEEAIHETAADYRPNHLTSYLFELARRFSEFYQQCPVLKAESDRLRASRLRLCDLTGRTIKQGLALLGIQVVDKM